MDINGYSAGVVIANDLKSQGLSDLELNAFFEAITDVLTDKELKITTQEANRNFKAYVNEMQQSMHAVTRLAGEEFLLENGSREGVTTTASGLQYQVLKPSNSTVKPTIASKVKVHYHGTTIDGTVFDSSVDRGEPISFPLSGVIQGWQEGLQLMPVGASYRLYIPYNLAYGDRAAGPVIKPYSALIFDVTLLEIE